ncbi:MAG: 3'-5' exonuclease [Desulforegulaceae bacterium]|nr:3'-5' exonuclease [Desulforegulaceae bacterium]
MKNIKLAISSEFLSSFADIPKKQQGKVMDFFTKFKKNPDSPGINYEKIEKAKDKNIRSVRIDDTYRGILLKPEKGSTYVLLWVDHHDKAYKWAQNKACKINPSTGIIQMMDAQAVMINEKSEYKDQKSRNLFDDFRERELLKAGVPDELMGLVRKVKDLDGLEKISSMLPDEVYEALFFLAEGESLETVIRDIINPAAEEEIDTEDFDKALERNGSKRKFYVVENELELLEILSAPLDKWRVFLHPSQRSIVENDYNGPVRVLGGAGTGKTVVAVHRAKFLASEVFKDESDKILFTTYTKNLATDIETNLKKICDKNILRKIEVVNLDKWVSNFLLKRDYNFNIDYSNKWQELWQTALDSSAPDIDIPESFYREEWDNVIQSQGITSIWEYFKASRTGRGVGLNRKMRKEIWPVFEEYRILLNENNFKETIDAVRDARIILENNPELVSYKAVIVDEAQDMSPEAFKLIKAIAPENKNNIFITGDAHQRIYQHKVVLSHCGINIMGRSKKLKINYRTTEETKSWAVKILENCDIDDLDGQLDDQKGYKSLLHGNPPLVKEFNDFNEELDFIADYLKDHDESELKNICVVLRLKSLLEQYEKALNKKGIKTVRIKPNEPDSLETSGVRTATMHRVKGLEFEKIIIPSLNDGNMPYKYYLRNSTDQTVKDDAETRERALLYVAATRAKKEVVITCFGRKSKFLV